MITEEELYRSLAEKQGGTAQERFAAASVVICGLGGLGSNVALALARAGVGRIHMIDFDRVETTNLGRQQYFPDQVGMNKADALLENVRRAAPYSNITAQTEKITAENIPQLLSGFDVVCECFDSADQKAMLVNAVLEQFPKAWLVSASGMAGIDSANSIQTRRVSKRFFLSGDGVSDVESTEGLFGTRVAVCAAHQAHTVLRILAGEYDS
ncbi:sulfur carrier protein ThiS adenylyltransferase [Ruminococcus sp. YE71]|uniref:sulfur carrier protein ThiS adenylyltransferase ThiF n=1 Tax=unclassified Ruminococcus TaxID=2608920 RepID=UPI00088D6BD2|nr:MULTISPECIES: sulfur carrier protein ThiS adenylyltransferase ThiF [unclassified Ruminococcus]SDA16139.1 sulfur carrier protein ThiS adenylyltransferase [Ruminococcus sp. YE78]SFW24025.1 sulfur carrier protein ThiS adenylyltransferase [Ruminococcus sp. YE71]